MLLFLWDQYVMAKLQTYLANDRC